MTDISTSTKSTLFKFILIWTILFAFLKLFEFKLINTFFVFFYIPVILVGYLVFIILFIYSIFYWIIKRNKISKPYIPSLLCLLSILFILFFPFNQFTLKIDFMLKLNEREHVINLITSKQIKFDLSRSNIVQIPKEYSHLSADKPNVLVEIIDNNICVFFFTFRGVTDNSAGFVYVPDEKIINKFKVGRFNSSAIFYEPIEITKIADNWFFVSNT